METIIHQIATKFIEKILKEVRETGLNLNEVTAHVLENYKEAAREMLQACAEEANQQMRKDKAWRKEQGLVMKEKDRPRKILTCLLAAGERLSVRELTEGISASYLAGFDSDFAPDESTVRKKLREYEQLGLLVSEKQGRKLTYRLDTTTVNLKSWQEAAAFFSEAADVYDAAEMLPWLRTFIGRIVSLTCSKQSVVDTFYADLAAMQAMYGGDDHAVS